MSNLASKEDYLKGFLHPLHCVCEPCTFHYDAVLRMETFDQDSRYVDLLIYFFIQGTLRGERARVGNMNMNKTLIEFCKHNV